MKKPLWMVLLIGLLLPGAFAQEKDITGTWQGTLAAGQPLRVVIKISKEDGKLTAVFSSIDQRQSLPMTTVVQQGSEVTMTIVAASVKLEEKLNADGTTMTGSWNQGGAALPLELKHVNASEAWAIPEAAPKIAPMPATADPAFEVATIKPSKPGQQGKVITIRGTRVVTMNTTVDDLITFAYSLQIKQIVGGQPWMETEKFDIDGAPDVPGMPNLKQMRAMVQKLLVDRFQLKFHDEKRELTVYALTVAKGGPKLTKSTAESDLPGMGMRGLGGVVVQNATMLDFCQMMQGTIVDRPMVDQTGLTGRWNFSLSWTPDDTQYPGMGLKIPPPSEKADAPPPLFTAIQEQAGLKMEATKAMTPVMAVDRVERPSAN